MTSPEVRAAECDHQVIEGTRLLLAAGVFSERDAALLKKAIGIYAVIEDFTAAAFDAKIAGSDPPDFEAFIRALESVGDA